MFKNKVIRYSTIAMLLAIFAYFFIENIGGIKSSGSDTETVISNPQAYIDKLTNDREEKDELFRSGPESPIADKEEFHGLHYFKPNLEYRVVANIVPYTGSDKTYTVAYTDSTSDDYERYGYANFTINGTDLKLLLLKNESVISVLFKDETNGKESYGGGRYMDYKMSDLKNNTIILDFNKAYNPYCAYQENFACPVPPKENTLPISIFAGEQYEGAMH